MSIENYQLLALVSSICWNQWWKILFPASNHLRSMHPDHCHLNPVFCFGVNISTIKYCAIAFVSFKIALPVLGFHNKFLMNAIENATKSFVRQNFTKYFHAIVITSSISTRNQHIVTRLWNLCDLLLSIKYLQRNFSRFFRTLISTFWNSLHLPDFVLVTLSSTRCPHRLWTNEYSTLSNGIYCTALFFAWFMLHNVTASLHANKIEDTRFNIATEAQSNCIWNQEYLEMGNRW